MNLTAVRIFYALKDSGAVFMGIYPVDGGYKVSWKCGDEIHWAIIADDEEMSVIESGTPLYRAEKIKDLPSLVKVLDLNDNPFQDTLSQEDLPQIT